jgi:hypothetical protein
MNVALLSQPQRELRAYLQRVAGDGGIVETPGEASTFIRRLRSAGVLGSTVIAGVAGGYKAGTLYSIIGPDLDVTRGTVANRINRAGSFASVASGVPATTYAGGVLKGTYVRSSLQNLFRDSEPATDPGQGTRDNVTFAINDWGIGLDGKVTLNNQGGTVSSSYSNASGTGTGIHTVACIARRIDGAEVFSNRETNTLTADFGIRIRNSLSVGTFVKKEHLGNGLYFFVEQRNAETVFDAYGVTKETINTAVPLEVSAIMVVQADVNLTLEDYIKTTGSAQTRNADVITDDLTLPQTSGIFTATLNNRLITGTRTIATLRGASTTWPVELRNNRFGFRDVVQGADTTAGTHRVSVWWSDSGETYRLYVDGTLIGTEQTGATPISGTIGTFDYGMNNSTNWLNDALSEIAVISGGTPSQAQTLSTL